MPVALERIEHPGEGRTLVFLHGLGADETDLFDLGELAPKGWRIVSLRAPFSYGEGFSWFDIRWNESGLDIDVEGAKRAAKMVIEELAAIEAPVVMGFSQGAMLLWLALLEDAPFLGAAMFSGAPLQEGEASPSVSTLVVHGRNDPVVPVEFGRALGRLQGPMGGYLETDDAHGIGLQAQSAFREWLAKI
ncbi:hypothetical protein EON81_18055 [bacterium]|nr:MAG: hypothetical protein EON81_18055 [bacterium]